MSRVHTFVGIFGLSAALSMTLACGSQEPARVGTAPAALQTTLNLFIPDSIQIDQAGSALTAEDANLFAGADPADGSASFDKPPGGPGNYIDWNDLGGSIADHVVYDWDYSASKGKDPTAFPQSNECVAPAQVLSKMDLTYVAAASNTQYAYFAVQRADNSGDAGYYWVITKTQPKLISGPAGPCSAGQQRLLYDFSVGDVLLGGHFQPSATTPAIRVWKAVANRTDVPAVDAVNFTDATLWVEQPNAASAVAVNTTITAPGAFGSNGVNKTSLDANGNLKPWIFAEVALPVNVFTGPSICGAAFFASVITRSSGSGGTSPDLKDLVGPVEFNFGSPTVTAQLTPTCTNSFGYELLSFTGIDGQPVANPSCSWTFSNGAGTSTTCSGTVTGLSPGSYTGTLQASDASGCSATVTTAPVNVYNDLHASCPLTPTCELSFGYADGFTGGSGDVSYAWTFSGSGGGTPTPTSSITASGSVAVDKGAVPYHAHLVVTDLRNDIHCEASCDADATPYAPIVVHIAPTAPAPVCPMSSDAVTYAATVSGGDGNYSYSWNGAACAGSQCVIDPNDSEFCASQLFSLTVDDGTPLCPPATSETETYTKVTIVTATNN